MLSESAKFLLEEGNNAVKVCNDIGYYMMISLLRIMVIFTFFSSGYMFLITSIPVFNGVSKIVILTLVGVIVSFIYANVSSHITEVESKINDTTNRISRKAKALLKMYQEDGKQSSDKEE